MAIRYHVLASDYDGTLATHGLVDQPTVEALEKLRLSGRKLMLVTGRELPELISIFPRLDLFHQIVAENGALLYEPSTKKSTLLAAKPPQELVNMLRARGVAPMSVGEVIIATWRPHETVVLECIRDLGLELQVIFNKDAVMVLPSGVNKASGLEAALRTMNLSHHNTVAVGDAENDHTFLAASEFGCAVENALPSLKERADLVTAGDHGAGVIELIEHIVDDDLLSFADRLQRHFILLGSGPDGPISVDPFGSSILLTGSSGSGKSTLTAGVLERLAKTRYQFCIIDPEGDYQDLQHAVMLGNSDRAAGVDEVLDVLCDPSKSVVVNLLGLSLDHRPQFFEELYPRLMQMRAQTGHPHWIILDEAHHLLPGSWQRDNSLLQDLRGVMLITVHPEHIPAALLSGINTLLVTGKQPKASLNAMATQVGIECPGADEDLPHGEYLIWRWQSGEAPVRFQVEPPQEERRRHHRKYAEGELAEDDSFYFRGPDDRLKLRAQNLMMFNHIAEGIDEETWRFHLDKGHYSEWFRDAIGDEELAKEAEEIEQDGSGDTRKRIKEAIEKRYTLPA